MLVLTALCVPSLLDSGLCVCNTRDGYPPKPSSFHYSQAWRGVIKASDALLPVPRYLAHKKHPPPKPPPLGPYAKAYGRVLGRGSFL